MAEVSENAVLPAVQDQQASPPSQPSQQQSQESKLESPQQLQQPQQLQLQQSQPPHYEENQHSDYGQYIYGSDENHMYYKYWGHSGGLPVVMKYAVNFHPTPHGYSRSEVRLEEVGPEVAGRTVKRLEQEKKEKKSSKSKKEKEKKSSKSKKKEKKRKQEKKMEKKQQQRQETAERREQEIHKLILKEEEKERKRVEFHQRVYQELQRREWERFYKHHQEQYQKEEKQRQKALKKEEKQRRQEEKKRQKEQEHHQGFHRWYGSQPQEQQQQIQRQYSPEEWQRWQNTYLEHQRLRVGPTPTPQQEHKGQQHHRHHLTEGERALMAKSDQDRRNMKTVKEFMKIAYSLKKAQTRKDALDRLLTPDAVFVAPGTFPGVTTCRDYVDAHIVIMKSVPNLRITNYDFECQEGNKVSLRYTAEGTHVGEPYHSTSNPENSEPIAPTHNHAVWSASALFELEDGKIKKFVKEWSKETMFHQLGWPLDDCVPPQDVAERLREATGRYRTTRVGEEEESSQSSNSNPPPQQEEKYKEKESSERIGSIYISSEKIKPERTSTTSPSTSITSATSR